MYGGSTMADACVIGVDLGGTKVLAGAVDAHLRVHHRAYRLSRPAAALQSLIDAVEEAREAMHGPVRDLMAERLGVPVAVDNDANAALVAETRFGAAAGARDVVMLTIGTGVGGGLLVDGRVVRGVSGAAAEL